MTTVTCVENVYPNVIIRPLVTTYPSAGGTNPVDKYPQPIYYARGVQTFVTVNRMTGSTVDYSFTLQFSGGNGSTMGGDPNNFVAYLIGTCVQNYPSPGTALTVTWPSPPANFVTIFTNDNNGGTNRQYIIQFAGYQGVSPTIYKSVGDAIPSTDTIVITVNYGVPVYV